MFFFPGDLGIKDGYNVSSKAIGAEFSVETTYAPRPWGAHKPWRFVKRDFYSKLLQDCPELLEIDKGMDSCVGKTGINCRPDLMNDDKM